MQMTKKFYFLIVLSVFVLSGCKKPPVACMELSSNNVSVGTTVEFTSCSKKALSYEWFITGPAGAPENSKGWSDEYFTNTFTVSGKYTVTLTAYEDFSFLGRSTTITGTISVN